MNSSELKHSYEVSGYWRTTPSGKRVWVPQYKKRGTVRQDELSDNRRRAELAEAQSRRRSYDRAQDISNYVNSPDVRSAKPGAPKQWTQYVLNKKTAEWEKETDAHFKDELALKRAQREQENNRYDNESLATTIRLESLNVAEDIKIAVNNFAQNAKVDVEDIIETSSKVVKSAIDTGIRAITSFFGRLFGRR